MCYVYNAYLREQLIMIRCQVCDNVANQSKLCTSSVNNIPLQVNIFLCFELKEK